MSQVNAPLPGGFIPGGTLSIPASALESTNPITREANRARIAAIAENDRRGRETERQRIQAQEEFEQNISASQLARRENVSPRLHGLILTLETENAELRAHSASSKSRK
jgi:hypothetical protein